jgi:hypothetical protein
MLRLIRQQNNFMCKLRTFVVWKDRRPFCHTFFVDQTDGIYFRGYHIKSVFLTDYEVELLRRCTSNIGKFHVFSGQFNINKEVNSIF